MGDPELLRATKQCHSALRHLLFKWPVRHANESLPQRLTVGAFSVP